MLIAADCKAASPPARSRTAAITPSLTAQNTRCQIGPRKGPRSPVGGLLVRTLSIGGAENAACFAYPLTRQILHYEDYQKAVDDPSLRLIPGMYRKVVWNTEEGLALYRGLGPADFDMMRDAWVKKLELVRRLHEAGVKLRLGTDTQQPFVVPGAAVQNELRHFVEAGIPIEEAWAHGSWRRADGVGDEDVTNKIGRRVEAYRQAHGEFAGALEDAARILADLEDRAIAPLEVLFADDAQAERVQGMNRLLQDAAAFCRLTPEDAKGEFETFERKLQSMGEELQSFREELFPKRAE